MLLTNDLNNQHRCSALGVSWSECEEVYEEYLGHFPEDQKEFDPYIEAYETMILDIDKHWVAYKDIEDQKEFAMAIKDCHARNILFGMRNKGQKIDEIIDNMTKGAKERLLKGYVRKE